MPYTDSYDYDVECCECGKTVKYCEAYSTMEWDTGYYWYYCSECYGVDLGDYDHALEEAWGEMQRKGVC